MLCWDFIIIYYWKKNGSDRRFFNIFFILFTSYAVLNTDFFAEETIEEIDVPKFEKFLEENELCGMVLDKNIVEEFLLNEEMMKEDEEGITAEIIN